MAYVGTPIDTQNQFQSLQGKRFNGDASTTEFTLDIAPNSVFDIEVFVENVRQDPNSAYTLNGTTLTFSAAPPSGTNNIYVIHQAKAVGTITAPVGGSIDMNGVELILDEDGDTSITADTDDQIDFRAGGTDTMHVINGKVGIGTSSPDSTLNLHAAIPILKLLDTDDNTFSRVYHSAGKLLFDADKGNTGSDSTIQFGVDDVERMRIDNSGRLLVGTTSTTINTSNFGFVFDASTDVLKTSRNVNGSSTSAEHFGNAGQIRFMGDGDAENTNNSYGALSDRTLKENETSANSQWNDIKALQIKNYNLIEYPDRPHLGVIAQDLESAGMNGLVKTYPDILYTEEDDLPEGVSVGDVKEQGHKTVKYSVLYMKAVKALQEAMTKIEDLESRVKTLEG